MIPVLTAFLVAGLGVWSFHLLNIPLPWLLGPIGACLLAALAGIPLKGVNVLADAVKVTLAERIHVNLAQSYARSKPAMARSGSRRLCGTERAVSGRCGDLSGDPGLLGEYHSLSDPR